MTVPNGNSMQSRGTAFLFHKMRYSDQFNFIFTVIFVFRKLMQNHHEILVHYLFYIRLCIKW